MAISSVGFANSIWNETTKAVSNTVNQVPILMEPTEQVLSYDLDYKAVVDTANNHDAKNI